MVGRARVTGKHSHRSPHQPPLRRYFRSRFNLRAVSMRKNLFVRERLLPGVSGDRNIQHLIYGEVNIKFLSERIYMLTRNQAIIHSFWLPARHVSLGAHLLCSCGFSDRCKLTNFSDVLKTWLNLVTYVLYALYQCMYIILSRFKNIIREKLNLSL